MENEEDHEPTAIPPIKKAAARHRRQTAQHQTRGQFINQRTDVPHRVGFYGTYPVCTSHSKFVLLLIPL